ncbi:MAG: two-component system response regulator, partial [Pseudomonas sp.]|uniref:HD-GYP domain-containing protein n=1 Tax=Pseudomonas sp. TaxID=306 RepID=UPI002FC90D65
ISAKLIALADAYDALISRRVYKKGMSHDQALEIIRQGCATHFDPDICEVFLANHGQFQAIAVRFDDRGQDG